jgi:hypothetical protein
MGAPQEPPLSHKATVPSPSSLGLALTGGPRPNLTGRRPAQRSQASDAALEMAMSPRIGSPVPSEGGQSTTSATSPGGRAPASKLAQGPAPRGSRLPRPLPVRFKPRPLTDEDTNKAAKAAAPARPGKPQWRM